MKKIFLLLVLAVVAFQVSAFDQCRPGETKFLGEVDFTITEVSEQGILMASIRDQQYPIMEGGLELEIGDHLSGVLFCRCVDIGHIPGRQTYWRKFIVHQQNLE